MNNNESSESFSFGSALYVQTKLLDKIIYSLSFSELRDETDEEVRSTIILMIQALGSSTHTIRRLIEKPGLEIRDCYTIARSISELSVNICYICTEGRAAAQAAKQHALQRSYRDLDRSWTVAGITAAVKREYIPASSSIPGLDEALADFTDRRGREKNDWIDLNVGSRIEHVKSKYPKVALSLLASTFSIYRHSSDILHGSFAGIQFFWKLHENSPQSRQDADFILEQHLLTIFCSVLFSNDSVIQLIYSDKKYDTLSKIERDLINLVHKHVEGLAK
jgi:hypothetical protein